MRILHISDLHIKRVDGKLDDAERIFRHLCNMVEEIHAVQSIDFIFITGDLVDRGGESFNTLKDGLDAVDRIVVEPIRKITSLPKSKVILVPGNHDVEGCKILQNFDESYPLRCESDVNWIVDEIKKNSEVGKNAIARLETYNTYAGGFAPAFLSSNQKMCSSLANHFIFEIGHHRIGISCLCSPWRCDKRGETKNLVLGIKQLNEADTLMENVDCRIALLHHDPALITDWEKTMVKNIILKKYDILFLGHTHLSDNTTYANEKGRTAYCCASGIIATNVGDKDYKNGFEVIDVDLDMKSIEIRKYAHNEDESFSQDLNFGKQGVSTLKFGSRRKIYPLKDILHNSNEHHSVLITSARLNQIKTELLNPHNHKLLIGAFSGLGKTRLVYEIALELHRNVEPNPNGEEFFYCEQSFESEELRNEVDEFVSFHREGNVVLIFDNVDYEFFNSVVSVYRHKKNIRIIGLTNKVLDIPNGIQDYMTITPGDMKAAVDEYIDTKVANRENNISAKTDIKKFSHGFPMLAVALVDKYNKGENINIHDADDILNICWNDHEKRDSQESQMLKLISLFQPFPIEDKAFDAILSTKCFSSLSGLDKLDRIKLRRQVINHYGDTILEVTDGGMNIRPYPLAMHLAKQWLKENGDPAILVELGKYIKSLDESIGNLIIECMCGRLHKMDDDSTAVALVAELTGENGFFGHENIVCSELGSRLILAMSTVNPLAVSNALYKIFSCKSAEDIRKLLSRQTKMNLLSSLRYIIFDGASFEKGIEILGKFALAETESYSNNSIHTFIDAFHILLPGTELNLKKRLKIIQKFASSESEIHKFTPFAIKGALACGHFVRTGGNSFGSSHKEDYNPTQKEVVEYWTGVLDVTISLIEKGEFINEIGDTIKTNIFVWSGRGLTNLMMPLLKVFGVKYGLELKLSGSDWLTFISNVERTSTMHPEMLESAKELYPLFIKDDFITELETVAYRFHNDVKFSSENYWDNIKEYYTPVVDKFIKDNIYTNYEILKRLLIDNELHTNYFVFVLKTIISDEQLTELWDAIYRQIEDNDNNCDSTFIACLVTSTMSQKPTEKFLEKLYVDGHHKLYIVSMARSETEDIYNLSILRKRYPTKDFIHDYLKNINIYINEDFLNGLFKFLDENFDENSDIILEFILRNSLWLNKLSDNHLEIISSMLAKVDVTQMTHINERDFWELAAHILKKQHNAELAKILNRKVLHKFSELNPDPEVGSFYEIAFKDYLNDIWDEFAEDLFGKNLGLYWHISNALSGYSLHSGMLFSLPEDYILGALAKYPDRAPIVIAKICPLYDNTNDKSVFAKWPQYLIDHYGNRKDVLETLSCNMGSFSCIGSVIPLYHRQIDVLMPLKEHQNETVRNWAVLQISAIEKEIQREQANEDFQRMHYE